jgi:hypothetical protein
MGLADVFVKSVVREIGRNYGKSISNSLLGNSHSTPVRVVGGHLGASTGGRDYNNELEKICKTWTIKGHIATFNVAQNIYKSFFDLVEEAQADGDVDINEILDLMKNFVMAHKEFGKVHTALEQLGKNDLAEKVDEMDTNIFEFFDELNQGFEMPPRPTGLFSGKKKKFWDANKAIKDNLDKWITDYKQQ